MIVEIEYELFKKKEYFNKLDELFAIFYSGKHKWNILNPRLIEESPWYTEEAQTEARSGKRLRIFFKKISVNSTRISGAEKRNRKTVKVREKRNCGTDASSTEQYPLDTAIKVLQDNLIIIVENATSDGLFLKALIKAYKYNEIGHALEKNWIDIDQAGGIGEMPKRIDAYLSRRRDFSPRIFIFCDSDKKYENDTIEGNAKKVREKCKEKNISCHILFKRAIENYLPDEIFKQNIPSELEESFSIYLSLNANQKDFYNIKYGFKKKTKGKAQYSLSENEKKFFAITRPNEHLLKNGFETRLFNPNSLFAKTITGKQFDKRCEHQENPKELKDILDKILKLV